MVNLSDVLVLPQSEGWLPYWQLFVATTAFVNSVQSILNVKWAKRVYPVHATPLQARTFAIWTLTAAMVRFHGAYHIDDEFVYKMTMWTYVFAFLHFSSEFFIYRTTKIGIAVFSTSIISVLTPIWMLKQYDYYVSA